MNPRRTATAVTLVVLLAACGSTGGTAEPVTTTDPPATTVATPPSKGWIGGEPDWNAATSEAAGAYESAAGGDGKVLTAMPEATAYDDAAAPPIAEGDVAVPSPQDASPLRAGSVDDNADFVAYLDYLARLQGLGIVTRPFDATGRVVVSVVGTSGLPVAGAEVAVTSAGVPVATIRTSANGTARFLPALYGASTDATFDFVSGGVTASAAAGGQAALTVDAPGGATSPVAVDVMFLLDATGSMGDEIDRLKTTIDSVAGRIAELDVQPDVRFGMTLYRDEGDIFVTSTYDFTADISDFRTALGAVVADGGGDYPEALDEGLADALSQPSWRDPSSTVQLVFLVADAPPQVQRDVQSPYTASIAAAIARGITITPIASSESDDQAEAVFRQIAQATGGRFVFLSYGAGGAATGTNTDIASTDYEELSLDDLIVRLVAEQLASLTGTTPDITPVTTSPTPPTNPDGQ